MPRIKSSTSASLSQRARIRQPETSSGAPQTRRRPASSRAPRPSGAAPQFTPITLDLPALAPDERAVGLGIYLEGQGSPAAPSPRLQAQSVRLRPNDADLIEVPMLDPLSPGHPVPPRPRLPSFQTFVSETNAAEPLFGAADAQGASFVDAAAHPLERPVAPPCGQMAQNTTENDVHALSNSLAAISCASPFLTGRFLPTPLDQEDMREQRLEAFVLDLLSWLDSLGSTLRTQSLRETLVDYLIETADDDDYRAELILTLIKGIVADHLSRSAPLGPLSLDDVAACIEPWIGALCALSTMRVITLFAIVPNFHRVCLASTAEVSASADSSQAIDARHLALDCLGRLVYGFESLSDEEAGIVEQLIEESTHRPDLVDLGVSQNTQSRNMWHLARLVILASEVSKIKRQSVWIVARELLANKDVLPFALLDLYHRVAYEIGER